MTILGKLSIKELEQELERRAIESAPRPLANPDLRILRETCQAHIDSIAAGTFHEDDDDQHYIFEEAIEALYGKDIWDWIQEQL